MFNIQFNLLILRQLLATLILKSDFLLSADIFQHYSSSVLSGITSERQTAWGPHVCKDQQQMTKFAASRQS